MGIHVNLIKHILEKHIPKNSSGGKVVLSLGESLLLVIESCRQVLPEDALKTLKQLYLDGVKSDEDRQFVKDLKTILTENHYTIKFDPHSINEDPCRRYFETHLAFNLIKKETDINLKELNSFTKCLKNRLFSLPNVTRDERLKIQKILKGDIDIKRLNKYELEYAELIYKLSTCNYYGLEKSLCRKLCEVARSTILATLNTQFDKSMPVDIYTDSIFTMGMDGRGRIVKKDHDSVKTTAKGLMTALTPLPLYRDIANPVEHAYEKPLKRRVYLVDGDEVQRENVPANIVNENVVVNSKSLFQRSADQASFMIESQWSQLLFSRQTQLYSNGISSTTLAQIRNIILQKRLGHAHYKDSFQKYMTLFAGLMVYNSGGHSFFEIFEVFKLPQFREIVEAEVGMKDAFLTDSLMTKWLYLDQNEAFEQALDATLKYMRVLLNKKIVNSEFNKDIENGSNESKQPTLHVALLTLDDDDFDKWLKNSYKGDINVKNDAGWTSLMVAAQLGKNKKIKSLLSAGADVNCKLEQNKNCKQKDVDRFSALELAIKSEQYDAVKLLVEAGAIITEPNQPHGELRRRSPALYFACRQNNMKLLQLIFTNEKSFSCKNKRELISDKKKSILTALKVENIEGIKTIVESLSIDERVKIFCYEFKIKLVQKAVELGNPELMKSIIELRIYSYKDSLDYCKLLNTSIEKGYLPIGRELLKLRVNKANSSLNCDDQDSFNQLLNKAIAFNQFNFALVLILYGANPDVLAYHELKKLETYLKDHEEYYSFIFNQEPIKFLADRAVELTTILDNKEQSKIYRLIKLIVDVINIFLPESIRLNYNEKTNVLRNISNNFRKIKDNAKVATEHVEKEQSEQNSVHTSFSIFNSRPVDKVSNVNEEPALRI